LKSLISEVKRRFFKAGLSRALSTVYVRRSSVRVHLGSGQRIDHPPFATVTGLLGLRLVAPPAPSSLACAVVLGLGADAHIWTYGGLNVFADSGGGFAVQYPAW
jgi:hypothetical protein